MSLGSSVPVAPAKPQTISHASNCTAKICFVFCCLVLNVNIALASETCVPKADGTWLCGPNVTAADAAPLPKRDNSGNRPPLLLINPELLDLNRVSENASDQAPVEQTHSTQASAQAAEATRKSSHSAAPSNTSNTMEATNESSFTVQLARASNPNGFARIRAQLRDNKETYEIQAKDGSWLLFYGRFATLELARAAIPKSIPGAFAKPFLTN